MDSKRTQGNTHQVWRRNLIGIADPTIALYRTFRLVYFRKTLTKRTMALVAPHLWDDPFENLVAKCLITDMRGEKCRDRFLGNIRKPVYGQCWSLASESDALWRIYSTVRKNPTTQRNDAVDDEGVKVRVSAECLLSTLWNGCASYPDDACFLGKVSYLPEKKAVQQVADEIGRSLHEAYSTGRGHAESLLIKREPFDHEREVRLVYVDLPPAPDIPRIQLVQIDPNALFDEVILDPRLGADDVRDREAEFRKLGLDSPVRRSDLYQRTNFEFVIR